MKIAFFLSDSEYGGGLNQSKGFLNQINKLDLRDFEVVFITDNAQYKSILDEKGVQSLLFKKNVLTKVLFFISGLKSANKYYIFNFLNPFEKFLKKNRIDLLIFSSPSFYSLYCENINYVINIWNTEIKNYKIFNELSGKNFIYQNNIISSSVLNAYKIIVFTNKNEEDLIKYYNCPKEKIVIQNLMPSLPNVYEQYKNNTNFDEIYNSFNLNKKTKWFFYPAQFWSHKNHIYLLNAFKILKEKKIENFGLLFSGRDKGNLEYIKKIINLNKLENNIKILGFLNEKQIISLYKSCEGLIVPTYIGRSCMPLLEGIYFKKKIIYGSQILDSELKKYVTEVNLNDPNNLALTLIKSNVEKFNYNENSYKEICSEKKFLNTYKKIIDNFNYFKKMSY